MKLDVQVKNDCVSFGDDFSIRFQRTLRIPDDDRTYPLPPGLGRFPLRHVDDFADRVPETWLERGGVYAVAHVRGGGELGREEQQRPEHRAAGTLDAVGDVRRSGDAAPCPGTLPALRRR